MIYCEYPCVQVFSRQAVQMDALISAFVEDIKQRAALYNEDSEGNLFTDNAVNEADGERKILFQLCSWQILCVKISVNSMQQSMYICI
jgi:hypothetical protein